MATPSQPDWYDDPGDPNAQRYWDGQEWTPHRQRKPVSAFTSPPPVTSSQPPATTMAAPAYPGAPAQPVPTSPPQQWATDNRPSQPQNLPKSHLVWAVFSIFFCFPFGIVALINANKVSTLWALGKYDEAQSAADSAKKFALWGTIVWAICIGGFFILGVVLPILFGLSVLGSSTSTPTYTTP